MDGPVLQQVLPVLIGAYAIFIGIAIILIAYFWVTNRAYRDVYCWIIAHLVFLTAAVYAGITAVQDNLGSSLLYKQLGLAAVLWAASICCLLAGAFKLKSRLLKK